MDLIKIIKARKTRQYNGMNALEIAISKKLAGGGGGGSDTWVFYDILRDTGRATWSVSFTDGSGVEYSSIKTYPDPVVLYDSEQAFVISSWSAPAYKTITITGGSDAEDPIFRAWLAANAVKQ